MDHNIVEGKFDQLKGKAKQAIGEALGDDRMANSGTADQVKGSAKEAWGNTKDAARSVAYDTQAHAETQHAQAEEVHSGKAHDIREKIASAAENVKNAITGKADDVRADHKRPA